MSNSMKEMNVTRYVCYDTELQYSECAGGTMREGKAKQHKRQREIDSMCVGLTMMYDIAEDT